VPADCGAGADHLADNEARILTFALLSPPTPHVRSTSQSFKLSFPISTTTYNAYSRLFNVIMT
jgi:hypothetical protein